MSTYHYDGSPCPESCTCAVREVDRLRTQLEAVTRERDALLDERRLVALELGCGLRVPLPGRLADVAAHLVAQVRIGEARLTRERDEARADAARLREALEQRSLTFIGVDDLPGRNVEWWCEMCGRQERDGHAPDCALASVPSAEPTRAQAERWLSDGPEEPGGTLAFHAEPTPPKCPGPSCKACIGEACDKCGKGSWNPEGPECTHDVLQRHEAPSAEPDYSGLCYAPECGGHCGYVHARGCEAIREYLADHGGDPYKAPPRAPSAEPTPRDMRVAETALREASDMVRDADDGVPLDCLADSIDAIDLAAVVTKAVKP